MRQLTPFLFLFIFSNFLTAQNTVIPDANFEQELINLGYDSGPIDGFVLTSNINTLTTLDVSFLNILDLTGIEDFTSLQNLDCSNNQLTNLNVTQNAALVELWCGYNQLNNLNISQNDALEVLNCWNNQLTSINTNQNPNLAQFYCDFNQITALDVSQNLALINFTCSSNLITVIDISQNTLIWSFQCGNNLLTILDLSLNYNLSDLTCNNNLLVCLKIGSTFMWLFDSRFNTNLTCIEVINPSYSTTNWTMKDTWSSYSSNCNNGCSSIISEIAEPISVKTEIYPNPTTGIISIVLEEIKSNLTTTLTIKAVEIRPFFLFSVFRQSEDK